MLNYKIKTILIKDPSKSITNCYFCVRMPHNFTLITSSGNHGILFYFVSTPRQFFLFTVLFIVIVGFTNVIKSMTRDMKD